MTLYTEEFAQFYDLIYEKKPYELEAASVNELLAFHGSSPPGSLLDLACGTGKHAQHLQRFGWRVTGMDNSPQMLQHARDRAAREGVSIDFIHGDMRELNLDQRFDAIVCLFDSIGYAGSNTEVAQTLQRIKRHLAKDGLFLFEAWHAPAMLSMFEPVKILRLCGESGNEIIRVSETSIDPASSTATVHFTFFVSDDTGRYSKHEEVHANRFFSVPELESLLKASGFDCVDWRAGLVDEATVGMDTWHVVGVARPV